jgi:hypothetical protein
MSQSAVHQQPSGWVVDLAGQHEKMFDSQETLRRGDEDRFVMSLSDILSKNHESEQVDATL